MSKNENERTKTILNRTAFHDYHILDKYEAGIVLNGCEVKSIRAGQVNLRDTFARVINNEIWLFNCHISPYKEGNRFNLDPTRDRKLLLHKIQIRKLIGKVEEKGMTLVPLNMFFSKNKVKVQIALAKAKQLFDKRQDLKERAIRRDMDYQFKSNHR